MNRLLRPALPRHDLGPLPRARTHPAVVSHTYIHTLALVALICVGFALRVTLLDAFPLREDEAIYGFWARTASTDPFFLHVWPDKPPLFIWLLQGTFALFGPSAATARLVSIFASTLTIPVVAWGALGLWRSRGAALPAALLFTFSPYAVSFAPAAYTDSLLALFGLGAVMCALRGRGLAAGLLLAAACMTKQQGLLYMPLVVGLLLCAPLSTWIANFRVRFTGNDEATVPCYPAPRRLPVSLENLAERPLRGDRATNQGWPQIAWALIGAAVVILPILWWDSQRWAVAPSPWALAQQTYAPLTWLPPSQWWARADAWAEWLWYLGGSWLVWGMLVAALMVALSVAARRPQVALLVGWGLAFVALHIVSSVQVWDRYLLPLAGWLALVASGPLAMVLSRRLPDWLRGTLVLLLLIGMAETIVPGVDAAKGNLPIGGDHGDYAGLHEAMAWVEGQDHSAILYHQVLGWHFRFYFYDELQPQGDDPSRFDLRWFPSAAYIADNAAKTPYPPKYLIVPEWATPRDLALHLALRGLTLEPRLRAGRFAVMEIVQPPRPVCDWCKSSAAWVGLPIAANSLTLPETSPRSKTEQLSMP
jgi:hypothetical protein